MARNWETLWRSTKEKKHIFFYNQFHACIALFKPIFWSNISRIRSGVEYGMWAINLDVDDGNFVEQSEKKRNASIRSFIAGNKQGHEEKKNYPFEWEIILQLQQHRWIIRFRNDKLSNSCLQLKNSHRSHTYF